MSRSWNIWASRGLLLLIATASGLFSPDRVSGQVSDDRLSIVGGTGVWAHDGEQPLGYLGVDAALSEQIWLEVFSPVFFSSRNCGRDDECRETLHFVTAGLRFQGTGRLQPFAGGFVGLGLGSDAAALVGTRGGMRFLVNRRWRILVDLSVVWTGSGNSAGTFLATSAGLSFVL